MKRFILLAGLLSLLLQSCSAPTPAPTILPIIETPQLEPTSTLTPPTETPSELMLSVTSERINCRLGPSTAYAFVNELNQGQFADVIGRDDNSTWWYIRDPGNPDGTCWVSAQVTQIKGDPENLPIIAPPPIEVTNINLRIEPIKIFVACSQFPQTVFFEAEVTSNGPILAVWRLESSTGYVSDENTVIFEEAGVKVVNGYYQVRGAGDYWISLHILQPNDIAEQLTFPANCTP